MDIPFFYIESFDPASDHLVLNEETSRHMVQVLRMQNDEQLKLTDGRGNLITASITHNDKKKCAVKIIHQEYQAPPLNPFSIAVSLVKNANRFEWFLEKATEIGVTEIIPLLCSRTEKQHFRQDRMKGVTVSAMLQSQQSWLPILHEPVKFTSYIQSATAQQKFIAHCEEESSKQQLSGKLSNLSGSKLILIGPEGDFTKTEIEAAIQNNFIPVALGNTRLRTETAAVVAAALLSINK